MFDPPPGDWEIVPFARGHASARHVEALNRREVEWFLRQFRSDYFVMSNLRELLAMTDPVARLDDDEVIRLTALGLAERRLMFLVRRDAYSSFSGGGGGQTPDTPVPVPVPPPPSPKPDEPKPTPPEPPIEPDKKHWFGIRVVDEAGKVLKDVTAQLSLTDGSSPSVDFSHEELEKDGTWRTQKVLESGQCEVSFPQIFNMEWWPQGGAAGDFSVNQSDTVGAGDCALSMADEWGFRDYLSVWNRAKNKDLKSHRPNANQLLEGDVLNAPDQKDKVVKKATDQVWTFVVKKKKPVKLRLLLADKDGTPLSGKEWELLEPTASSGTTGADGLIELPDFHPQEKSARLKVKLSDPPPPLDPLPPEPPVVPTPYPPAVVAAEFTDKDPAKSSSAHFAEWEFKVGSLPSFNTSEGVLARLHNLGFGCDVGDTDDRSKRAVKAYQRFFQKNKNGSGVAKDIESDIRDRHDKPK
jgi:hypothetical protein